MKKLLLTTLSFAAAMSFAHAQGTVQFQNIPPVNRPVRDEAGVGLAGTGFMAQLWAAAPGGTLAPIGAAVTFTTSPGFFVGGSRTIDSVPGGGTADIQVRAWRVNDGGVIANTWAEAAQRGRGIGQSLVFTLATGGGGTPPGTAVNLIGLSSFSLVPEPSTIALGILGGLGTLFLVRRRK